LEATRFQALFLFYLYLPTVCPHFHFFAEYGGSPRHLGGIARANKLPCFAQLYYNPKTALFSFKGVLMRLELMDNLKRWRIYFFLVVFILSGCGGGSLRVSINSNPQWATLYQGDEKLGLTPKEIRYEITEKDEQQGYMIIPEMRVLWLSGAEAHHSSTQIPLDDYEITFKRPLVPGLETDAMYEVQKDILKATKDNERAIKEAKSAAEEAKSAAEDAERAAESTKWKMERGPNHCSQRWSNGVLYCN